MAEKTFFLPEARAQVTSTIKEVEAQTSAELVVSVRKQSGHYRHTDYLVGFVTSLATLALLLFLPTDFQLWAMPLDVAIGFAVGAVVCANVWTVRRLLTSRALMKANVHAAACAAFVHMKVSKTSGRNGILVYVSMFERRVEVLPDLGIDVAALGAPWERAVLLLQGAMAGRVHIDRFVEALRLLGPTLGKAMPHMADDVNELPDDVDAA